MSEKRLSERMSDTTHAVGEAQDALQAAITKAINTHFDAGIEFERLRIIKLLESYWDLDGHQPFEAGHCQDCGTIGDLIGLIKGEQK